jgi:hypothetical protein
VIWLVIAGAAVSAGWLLGRGDAVDNLRAARAAAAVDLLAAAFGLPLGLLARERLRARRGHASPTAAYIGKRLFLAAAVAASVYAFSPVAWPPESLHAGAALGAAGLALWAGNLPLKL